MCLHLPRQASPSCLNSQTISLAATSNKHAGQPLLSSGEGWARYVDMWRYPCVHTCVRRCISRVGQRLATGNQSPSAAYFFVVLLNKVSHYLRTHLYQGAQPVSYKNPCLSTSPVLGSEACSTKTTFLKYNRDLKIKFRSSCQYCKQLKGLQAMFSFTFIYLFVIVYGKFSICHGIPVEVRGQI